MKFQSLLPELYVTDFEASIHFYRDIVGFQIEYTRDNPNFAFLSYGKSQLMIQELRPGEKEQEVLEHPFGRGINFQIETESVQEIIDSLEKNDYPLKRGVKDSWYKGKDMSYGCREILVQDPDGYLLRFSEDLGERRISE
ncbi:MAG: VOC family protein [bacterium]|nr:VOC family protein [bacterium]